MGTTHSAEFGIGYEVMETDDICNDEMVDGLEEYIISDLSEGFLVFESGYFGQRRSTFIVIDYPFNEGLDLTEKKELLEAEIKRLRLDIVGFFGAVGGLNVFLTNYLQ